MEKQLLALFVLVFVSACVQKKETHTEETIALTPVQELQQRIDSSNVTMYSVGTNNTVEPDSTVVPITTFGLSFDSDPRFGFKNYSVKMPKIMGLFTSSRWAYCRKDSCNTGYYIVGIRCPENKFIRRWVNNKLWEKMKNEGFEKKAPSEIVDELSIPISKATEFYLNQWQRHYDNYLNGFLKCEGSGRFAFPTEQYGLIITDIWKHKKYCTLCVHEWYDMLSNGCPYSTSFHTIDGTKGKELTLYNILSKTDYTKIERLLESKLLWMKEQRDALPLQEINYLENCSGVALIEEGLLFYYCPYTIGAGYEGQYNVVISYEQLKKSGINITI